MRLENVLGKIQPSKRCYELAFVFNLPRDCVYRIRLWPLRRDDHSGVLIGAAGTRRSHWPARALADDVSTMIDR